MDMEFVFPTMEHEQAVIDYRQEWLDCKPEEKINGSWGLQRREYENYEKWLGDIEKLLTGQSGNPDIDVPTTTYFAFVNERIVGNIQIRRCLNDYLLNTYGNIGYGIRPSERRKGYATKMLALALEKCREFGIDKAIVSCDIDNIGSVKTILKNGGVLGKEFTKDDGSIVNQYWIFL